MSQKINGMLVALLFCGGLFLSPCGKAKDPPLDAAAEQMAAELTDAQAEQKALRLRTAPIHSAALLREYLAKEDASSPLNLLSPAAKKRFVESLRFNEKGVTSFTYSDIEAELSASQAYRLLSLFGLESTISSMHKMRVDGEEDINVNRAFPMNRAFPTPGRGQDEDHNDYKCESPHNCVESVGTICMSGC